MNHMHRCSRAAHCLSRPHHPLTPNNFLASKAKPSLFILLTEAGDPWYYYLGQNRILLCVTFHPVEISGVSTERIGVGNLLQSHKADKSRDSPYPGWQQHKNLAAWQRFCFVLFVVSPTQVPNPPECVYNPCDHHGPSQGPMEREVCLPPTSAATIYLFILRPTKVCNYCNDYYIRLAWSLN